MNEGLEALKHLNKNIIVAEDIDEDFNIIENELKDYYALKKECEEAKWYQEHKALKIIKNIGILKPYETSSGQCWLETICDAAKITKDNYDSLKEAGL